MELFHSSKSSLVDLLRDAKGSENQQTRGVSDSTRESALRELQRRGYSPIEITQIRLGKYEPTEKR